MAGLEAGLAKETRGDRLQDTLRRDAALQAPEDAGIHDVERPGDEPAGQHEHQRVSRAGRYRRCGHWFRIRKKARSRRLRPAR